MWRLRITDSLLHPLNLIFNMAVGNENILPAIIVVIKEEATETERHQRSPPNFRLLRLINEQSVSLVVIKRDHLVGEVTDDDAGVSAAIVVGSIGAHAGPRDPILAEPDPRSHTALLECSILLVEVQLVRLRVVRDQDVRPTICVVIENRDS